MGKHLNMTFERYDARNENNILKIFNNLWIRLSLFLSSKDPEIKLLDPQKRLEDSFLEMSKNTSEQIKSIKSLFNNQVSDVESKLNNSQVRVEDGINEMARNTTSYMENLIEELNANSKNMVTRLEKAELKLESSIGKLNMRVMDELSSSKIYFDDKLNRMEKKLIELLNLSTNNLNLKINSVDTTIQKSFSDLEETVKKTESKIFEQMDESTEYLNKELKELKFETIEVTKYETNRIQTSLRNMHESVNFVGSKVTEMGTRRF